MNNAWNVLRRVITSWVLVGVLVFGCILFALSLILLNYIKHDAAPQNATTAIMNIIPAPSPTLAVTVLPPTSAADATSIPAGQSSGSISIGNYVQIAGTGGNGLRLRAEPGLETEVRFLAIDAEVFRVTDGPRQLDGYTWWYLVGPYDENIQGWAVENYLVVIQFP
jgi:hypothetical protein